MKNIKQITSKLTTQSQSLNIIRHKYLPYSEKLTKHAWFGIAKNKAQNLNVGISQAKAWSELIKYAHGDETGQYNVNSTLFIVGMTGSGKTLTMQILSDYLNIDEVLYVRNGVTQTFNFRIISSREIVADFLKDGYDGIAKWMVIGNLCIDDLGAEISTATNYGTKLDVMTEVIETRYNKGLFTHFTSNLSKEMIKERYNDRVYSRIFHNCNIIILNDNDYRVVTIVNSNGNNMG